MTKILVPHSKGIFNIAADILADYWKQITGESLETVTADDGGDLLVLGSDATNAFTHAQIIDKTILAFAFKTGTDEYAFKSAAQGGRKLLFFAGARPRALLYAIYDFLERCCGCRYFWDGDIVPAGKIDITGLDVHEAPRFDYRGLRYFAHRSLDRFQAEHWDLSQWKHEIDWIVKKRLNMFMLRIGLDDLFQKTFPDIVSYPEWKVPEAVPRSYDDRNLFWPLQFRGQLRKQLLAYARERDLMHPEDVGTMSHWYSRTPLEYLDKVKPGFMPQSTTGYAQPTGLVWDIRKDANLDAYFKLTETHIREYGSPELFHTIGLAERRCYKDDAANHEIKLYTYRRIIAKLREKYPLSPLLVGSWDFPMYWTPMQVRELLSQFDPSNTLILEYTSDTDNEGNNFLDWDMMGKFPWIFGIFHAYESHNEMRGNYDIIERRLPMAVEDKMCKGLIFWPEISHSDTLMLEYLAANAWHPTPDNIAIESFLPKFCAERYGTKAPVMTPIWQRALPLIKARFWNGPGARPEHYYVNLLTHAWYFIPLYSSSNIVAARNLHNDLTKPLADASLFLRALADLKLDDESPFVVRDTIDLVRMAAIRTFDYVMYGFIARFQDWRDGANIAPELTTALSRALELASLLYNILASSDDFSLNASLKALRAKHETNPDFEYTLKGNLENGYCRTQCAELISNVCIPELMGIVEWFLERINSGNRAPTSDAKESCAAIHKNVVDKFYDEPLANMAPDRARNFDLLPVSIRKLADIIDAIFA